MRISTSVENYLDFDRRRVGLEFEQPLTDRHGNVVREDVVQSMYDSLADRGWVGEPESLSGNVLYVDKVTGGRNTNISTDCGWSTLEIAMPPQDSLGEAEDLFHLVRSEVTSSLPSSARLLSIGMVPGYTNPDDAYKTSKPVNRFEDRLWLHNVFVPLNAHHVGVSVRIDEGLPVLNELIQTCGLAVALCGNACISEYTALPWKDWRIPAWDYVFLTCNPDSGRLAGIPPGPFRSLAHYYTYFWEIDHIPLLGPVRAGELGRIAGDVGWLRYFHGQEWPGKLVSGATTTFTPEAADLVTAQITFWPHVKLKIIFDPDRIELPDFLNALDLDDLESYVVGKYVNMYIEFRPCASAPMGEEMALPALVLGLVENITSLGELTARYTWQEWRHLLSHAAVAGLDATVGGGPCLPLAKQLVDIASKGLEARELGEEAYLDSLYDRLERKMNPADVTARVLQTNGKEALLDSVTYR